MRKKMECMMGTPKETRARSIVAVSVTRKPGVAGRNMAGRGRERVGAVLALPLQDTATEKQGVGGCGQRRPVSPVVAAPSRLPH